MRFAFIPKRDRKKKASASGLSLAEIGWLWGRPADISLEIEKE
jgi:hypothetical protein